MELVSCCFSFKAHGLEKEIASAFEFIACQWEILKII